MSLCFAQSPSSVCRLLMFRKGSLALVIGELSKTTVESAPSPKSADGCTDHPKISQRTNNASSAKVRSKNLPDDIRGTHPHAPPCLLPDLSLPRSTVWRLSVLPLVAPPVLTGLIQHLLGSVSTRRISPNRI